MSRIWSPWGKPDRTGRQRWSGPGCRHFQHLRSAARRRLHRGSGLVLERALRGSDGWLRLGQRPTQAPGAFSTDGWGGGGFVGYNFQTANNLVFGVEGDVTGTGKSGSRGIYSVKNPWDATLRGRAGYAIDHFLIYGTGGLALGGVNVKDGTTTENQTRVGWTIGAGVDAAVTDNIIARMEFRHTDLGSSAYNSLTGTPTVSHSSNDLLVGVGMKF